MDSGKTIDAGQLRERPQVLSLVRNEEGLHWASIRRTPAAVEVQTKKNVWSVHGIGATGVKFILRRQRLGIENALLWRGQHCFVTSVTPYGRNHMEVDAAFVVVSECWDRYTDAKFPGIMTEEYHRHGQEEPQAINTLRHVLVTPKAIVLTPGKLVEVDGTPWPILTAHLLDPAKNEYIIERVVDL